MMKFFPARMGYSNSGAGKVAVFKQTVKGFLVGEHGRLNRHQADGLLCLVIDGKTIPEKSWPLKCPLVHQTLSKLIFPVFFCSRKKCS